MSSSASNHKGKSLRFLCSLLPEMHSQDSSWHSLRWLGGKESVCQCRRYKFDPWVGEMAWRREWQSTPVFWPGKSIRQGSLAGYSSWGGKSVSLEAEQQASQHTHCGSVHRAALCSQPAQTQISSLLSSLMRKRRRS